MKAIMPLPFINDMIKDEVIKYLDNLNISYELFNHKPVSSIEECKQIEDFIGGRICKNLFLKTTNGKIKILLIIDADKKFVTKDISKKLETSRLSFCTADEMIEYLNTVPGSLSIMSLIFDKDNSVDLAIDKDVISDEFIYCHPCQNDATLKIKTKDVIETLIPLFNREYKIIQI